MKKRLISLITTGFMLTSAAVMPPVQAAGKTVNAPADTSLPDWIPTDYASAIEFLNNYGVTHVEDGLICLVHESGNPQLAPHFEANGQYAEYAPSFVYGSTYERYPDADDSPYIMVSLFRPTESGTLTLSYKNDWEQTDYTFETDAGKNITETDIYGWLPDSVQEYRDYTLSHPHNIPALVKDNYVVFFLSHSAGTAYKWTQKDDGGDCFELAAVSHCTSLSVEPVGGGEINTIYAYKAVKDGYAKISYDYGSVLTSGEIEENRTADCVILDNAQTVLLPYTARISFADASTGELLSIPNDSENITLYPTIGYATDKEGEFINEDLAVFTDSNPYLWDFSARKDADVLDVDISRNALPAGYMLEEDHRTVTEYDNGSVDVVFKLKKKVGSDLAPGETRITLYDKDTGELIPGELLERLHWGFGVYIGFKKEDVPGGWIYTSPIYLVNTNPCIYKDNLARLYKEADKFSFCCEDQPEVITYENGSMDLIFRTKLTPSGNINGDSEFGIADVVTLQKWLLNDPDVEIYDWAQGDLDLDNRLTGFDLCLMKQELIEKTVTEYVEPEQKSWGAPMTVVADPLKLYLGPDESYGVIDLIFKGEHILELGYQKSNHNWIFTNYNDKYGWIRVYDGRGNNNVYWEAMADKPVIYLYPEQETDVHVELELTESDLSTTYPKYNNGWDVTAYPDGSLLNKADGTHHKYLFWDSVNCRTHFDFSKGFCVAGSDTESFLKEKLTYMGLTEEEMNEFIVYWLPRMEHNAYNLISFQGEAYTDSAKLNITPAPDSLLRVFMTYVPLDEAVDIEPQQLDTFERKGFTVVEWGGSEIG